MKSANWLGVRVARLIRDSYRCVVCGLGIDEVRLSVHLYDYMRGKHELATIEDCETRCLSCHGSSDAIRSQGGVL